MDAGIQETPYYQQQWKDTKESFLRALRSPEHFNAFTWLFRLIRGYGVYLYFRTGLSRLGLHTHWRSSTPVFGMSLICLVILSYFTVLRGVILPRWCCHGVEQGKPDSHRSTACAWGYLHDGFVMYLAVMILFHFATACFQSPGVALSTTAERTKSSNWESSKGQGGIFCFQSKLDVKAEKVRVSKYKGLQPSPKKSFPSTQWTFCEKCQVERPPRCHHCSVCNRCILRFDHHCIWLNNCIGQYNYRSFLLTLCYLTLGCWYGVVLLWPSFYEPLRKQIEDQGLHIMYDNKTGFLNLPTPRAMLEQMTTTGLDPMVVIKLVTPLLISVGVLQTVFLAYHLRYTMLARTTLEYKIILDWQYQALISNNCIYTTPENPFDFGWFQNMKRVLGSNPILLFLPVAWREDAQFQNSTHQKLV